MPAPKVIHDLLARLARTRGTAPAAMDGDNHMDYASLAAEVDRFAKALLATGIRPRDRVATMVPPSLDFWLTCHAAVSIGAIWHGLNPVYRERDFTYILGDAKPTLVFTRSPWDGRDYCAELQAAGPAVPHFVALGEPNGRAVAQEAFLARGASVSDADLAAARAAVRPEDIAVIVYTSGTTGQPKGAMLSHRAIVQSALDNAAWMKPERLACSVNAAVINHVGGLNNLCMNVLAGGGRIVFHHRADPHKLGELRRRERPTYLVTSPTGFMMSMAGQNFDAAKLDHFQLIVCGGATTPEAILRAWEPCGARITSVYGQTETTGIVTRTDEDAPIADVAETIGKPLPQCEFRVARADGSEAGVDEHGELQMRGAYAMSGYFGREEATREAFTADGYLRTGDIGYRRADGNLVFVGRIKEMFKSGGYNVYPMEIEQAIAEHPAVLLAAVLPVPHPMYQEVGHAFVMPHPGESVSADELRTFLKQRIANYKVPKDFDVEQALPLLPNGKIDKQALVARLAARSIDTSEARP